MTESNHTLEELVELLLSLPPHVANKQKALIYVEMLYRLANKAELK